MRAVSWISATPGAARRLVGSPRPSSGLHQDGDSVAFDHEHQRPVMGSRIVDLGGGRFQIRAGSQDEADRLMRRIVRRAAKRARKRRSKVEDRPLIRGEFCVRTDIWRREAAKIGLAIGAHAYPPEWRHGDHASRLREWLNDRDTSTEDGKAPPLVPSHLLAPLSLVAPDVEHLVSFQRARGETILLAVICSDGRCLACRSTMARRTSTGWRGAWIGARGPSRRRAGTA